MHGLNHYDYSARHYDPARLQFTTVDPHAENDYSWSPYAYVGNNPLRFIDPTGKDWGDVVIGYGIGIATNLIPGSSSWRDSYTPTSSSDYNRALEGIDNASIVAGGSMIAGGTAAVATGGVVAVTGVGAPEGAVIATGGVVLLTAREAYIASGMYLMANTASNKLEGYDRGGKSEAKAKSSEGRSGKQERLRELGNDPKLGKSDKGWIK